MHSALYRIALPERFRSSRRRDGGERKLCGCTLTVPRKASSRDRHFYESAAGEKTADREADTAGKLLLLWIDTASSAAKRLS